MIPSEITRKLSSRIQLGDQPELLSQLHRLGPPMCAELFEQSARVRFDGVLAYVSPLGDLLVAEAFGNELQNLELARRDAQRVDLALVTHEVDGCRDHDFADDHGLGMPRELEAEPDSQGRKHRGDQPAVDLD